LDQHQDFDALIFVFTVLSVNNSNFVYCIRIFCDVFISTLGNQVTAFTIWAVCIIN
jgi:hypothetical protein